MGEILKNKEKARELLGVSKDLELMGVVAFGHPSHRPGHGERDSLEEKLVFVK